MNTARNAGLEMDQAEFRSAGYELIDQISSFIDSVDNRPVTYAETPARIRAVLGQAGIPREGKPASEVLGNASDLLFNHSLFNGHSKFWGYITSSAAPIGALADLLAAAVNPNCGAFILSPMATEIEKQTIRWLAELIGYDTDCGGILVSGGNMANFTGFLAARTAKTPKSIQTDGLCALKERLMVYCSNGTHTWIDKATSLFGHGTDSIRWIPTNSKRQMDNQTLEQAIEKDLEDGHQPFLVIGTAGDVSTGAVDDLMGAGEICKKYNLWFHIDGAYGAPAAALSSERDTFLGLSCADSIALDPHKWLYCPLEAGCTLVKNPQHLIDTYSSHPEYYNFDKNEEDPGTNFYGFGLQNSRGFRALKVWLAIQQVGRSGYERMIGDDIALARLLFDLASRHEELEAVTHNLSITTFRYVPKDILLEGEEREKYLDQLNEDLVDALQAGGEVFLSNAIVDGRYCCRVCIVNFRTSEKDIRDLVDVAVREGRKLWEAAGPGPKLTGE